MPEPVIVIANGDLRLAANQKCWPAQSRAEEAVMEAIRREGREVKRGHPFDPVKAARLHRQPEARHGGVPRDSAGSAAGGGGGGLAVQPSRLLHGLYTHRGPILTVANWSGEWPGLVGMLNLNGSLTKAGVKYSTLWSVDFTDEFFLGGLRALARRASPWSTIPATCARSTACKLPARAEETGAASSPPDLRRDKAIMGIFDEGCMGMYNAIIPDELLHPTGVFKERLSQSALYAAMQRVTDAEARDVRCWLDAQGHAVSHRPRSGDRAHRRPDPGAVQDVHRRPAHRRRFRLRRHRHPVSAGLEGSAPGVRPGGRPAEQRGPPAGARCRDGRVLYEGEALPHFNEVDECAGLDALVTNRIWTQLGFDPETTLHDVRYGETYCVNGNRGIRLGVRDLRRRAAQRISSAATRARSASASRRCISGWAAAR